MSLDPGTLSIIATVASTAMGAVGSMQQGAAAKGQAAYQAQVMRNNQILAERAAADAEARGKVQERRQAQATKQLIGKQRAIMAGNNVVVDTGSALDITSDTAALGKLEELYIRNNAEREASGFRAQGMNFSANANLADARGKAAGSSALWSAGGTLLGGIGSVAEKWYTFKRNDPEWSFGGAA
jgi:hypothetical protein